METAPFFDDVSGGPGGGFARWLTTSDGVRIRIGVWPEGTKGTVLLFPGRTEYVEKYGRAAVDLAARGFATVSVDWRGQGLADRFLPERTTGHVENFHDFQHDVDAVMQAARDLGLPKPYFLISHSMGGCIALRSLVRGFDVRAAAFSAPMWGILISSYMRPVARTLSRVSSPLGFGGTMAPGTKAETYVKSEPFQNNQLTTDPDMFAYMKQQVTAYPELALGGPSLNWLHEALTETDDLARTTAPDIPVMTMLGTNERIVDARPIKDRMAGWKGAKFEIIANAEHELMMETLKIRSRFFDAATALFDANR